MSKNGLRKSSKINLKAISLIEALVSIVVVGVGLVAVLQMAMYAVRSADISIERNKVNFLAESVMEGMVANSRSLTPTSLFRMNVNNCSYQPTNNTERVWLNNFNNILNANNINSDRCLSGDLKNVDYDSINAKSTINFQLGTRRSFYGFSKIE
jgi:Tfp pilus assembly protein PilV